MTVAHEVVRVVIDIAPKNPGDSQPDSFETQLQIALTEQNAGTYDDWKLVEVIPVPIGSSKKAYTLVFERDF